MCKVEHNCNLKDIIEWDIPNWSVALKFWEKNTAHDLSSINALEIGSRNGGLSLWAALHGMNVLCTDKCGPTNIAIEKHKKYNVSRLIRYEALDAVNIPYLETFDVVLLKSVLGGIGSFNNINNQLTAVNEIHKSLKKGGEFWFAENLVSPIHQFFRSKYVEWGNRWRYVTIQEMEEFLSIFSEVKYRTVGFLGAFGRSSFQRSVFGRMDRIVIDKLVPKAWRYIMIGIAKK